MQNIEKVATVDQHLKAEKDITFELKTVPNLWISYALCFRHIYVLLVLPN